MKAKKSGEHYWLAGNGTPTREGRGNYSQGESRGGKPHTSSCKENNQAEEYGNWSNESVLSGVLIYILQSLDSYTRTRTDCM